MRLEAGVAVVLSVVAVLVGCGAEMKEIPVVYTSPSAIASSIPLRITHDTEYGFTMAYPEGWLRSVWTRPAHAEDEARQYALSYADPDGAHPKETYIDAEQVAVYQLNKEVSSSDISEATAFKVINGWILYGVTGLDMRTPTPKKVDIHGETGWMVQYAYEVENTTIWAESVLVCKGKHAYWATSQASWQTWHTAYPTLCTAMSYFRVD